MRARLSHRLGPSHSLLLGHVCVLTQLSLSVVLVVVVPLSQDFVIGALLGDVQDNVVSVTNCFPVRHTVADKVRSVRMLLSFKPVHLTCFATLR